MKVRIGAASQDLRVIVLPNFENSSEEIWISTDYGNNFTNMYNSELSAFGTNNTASASVSPDGHTVILYRNFNDIYFYRIRSDGTYYLLSIIPNSGFINERIDYVVQANDGKIMLFDNYYHEMILLRLFLYMEGEVFLHIYLYLIHISEPTRKAEIW